MGYNYSTLHTQLQSLHDEINDFDILKNPITSATINSVISKKQK